ncbi:hypothetical protein FSB78_10495 [Sphingomonas ginsenosidivorax]|uniref:HNH endonuclease n=1 Tax=Sphingomonas ginsenosidivorax TaxID=862135 RepID=A0A5C6UEW5_9SPHN|nr:hypothetical protein [Sphingomonas ginsenosidivorax]TXC71323.1 hypothetical protein FSB78_10495 [Sphingomonas ginsenosidivorax]
MTMPNDSRKGNDFTEKTRAIIGHRAGFRCSHPACRAPTAGPSAESEAARSDTATASHIISASPNPPARRRRPVGDKTELHGPDNGIWMCGTDGRLIDTDESTYTVETLRHWKRLAERRAHLAQILKRDSVVLADDDTISHPLAPLYLPVGPTRDLVDRIDTVLIEACSYEVWGAAPTHVIRELLAEIVRNAASYGGATEALLTVEPTRIHLTDNGAAFDLLSLVGHQNGRGGQAALSTVLRDWSGSIFVESEVTSEGNRYTVALIRTIKQLQAVTPCTFTLNYEAVMGHAEPVPSDYDQCSVVHLIWDIGITYSDVDEAHAWVAWLRELGKAVVLVAPPMSDGLQEFIRAKFPEERLLILRRDVA